MTMLDSVEYLRKRIKARTIEVGDDTPEILQNDSHIEHIHDPIRTDLDEAIIHINPNGRGGVNVLKLSGAGAGVGILGALVASLANGNTVHAHDPERQVDGGETITIPSDSTLYEQMIRLGYTHAEIVTDGGLYGLTQEDLNNLQLEAGSEWIVHPEIVHRRDIRLGRISIDALPQSVIVPKGSTVYRELSRHGFSPKQIEESLRDNQVPKSDHQTFKFPDGAVWHVSGGSLAGRNVTLGKGDTIHDTAIARGVDTSNITKLLAHLSISEEEARKLPIGHTYTIPASFLGGSLVEQVETLQIDPGDDLFGELQQRGVTDAVALELAIGLEDQGLELESLQPGQVVVIPAGITRTQERDPHHTQVEPAPDSISELAEEPDPTETLQPMEVFEPQDVLPESVKPIDAPVAIEISVPESTLAPEQDKSSTIRFVGDSLTDGMYNLGNLGENASGYGFKVDVSGSVAGQSIGEGHGNVSIEELVQNRWIVVQLGTNAKESDDNFSSQLLEFILQVRATAEASGLPIPHIAIVNQFEDNNRQNAVRDETRNIIIDEIAEKYDAWVIDWNSFANSNPQLFEGDAIHPNDYSQMVNFVLGEINSIDQSFNPAQTLEPSAPELSQPVEVEPFVRAYQLIQEVMASNNGILDATTAQAVYAILVDHGMRAPEGNPEFDRASELIALPPPTAEMPYVIDPATCAEELFGTPEVVMSIMYRIAAFEYFLAQPENTQYREYILVIRDIVSGDHQTHDTGTMVDYDSKNIHSDSHSDGPVFNQTSPNYSPEFTETMLIAGGMSIGADGRYLYKYTVFTAKAFNKQINRELEEMGRDKDAMKTNGGHVEHIHDAVERHSESYRRGTPNTNDTCTFRDQRLSDEIRSALISRRANYPKPVETVVDQPVPELPTPEPQPIIVPTPETPLPEVSVPLQETPAINSADLFAIPVEQYITEHMAGETIVVTKRNGKSMQVPPEIQRLVDVVWRIEGGKSPEVVKEALLVAFAESSLNNEAVNKSESDNSIVDSCLFQMNRSLREYIESLGYDYDTLQDNPEACVRAAFALYQEAEGKEYSMEWVQKWIDDYGLILLDDLEQRINDGEISTGWAPWLMSSRMTGLL